MGYSLQAG